MDPRIGVSIERLMIDLLHCLYLGAAQEWVARAMWALLLADVFGIGEHKTEAERIELGVQRLRCDLWDWYSAQRDTAASDFTPLQDLMLSMLGTKVKESFSSKAAECKTILPFVLLSLEHHRAKLGEQCVYLIGAGHSLLHFVKVVRDAPAVPDAKTCQDLIRDERSCFQVSCFSNCAFELFVCHAKPRKCRAPSHLSARICWMPASASLCYARRVGFTSRQSFTCLSTWRRSQWWMATRRNTQLGKTKL